MRNPSEIETLHNEAQERALKIQKVQGGWEIWPRTDTVDAVRICRRVGRLIHEVAEVNTPDGDLDGHAEARVIAAAPETAAALREAANNIAAALGWLQSAKVNDATRVEMAIDFLTKGAEARRKALDKAELGE